MLIEEDIQKILDQLESGKPITLAFDGSDIIIHFLDDASKLFLTTSIYKGGNYIPSGVRRCLSQKAPIPHPILKTFFNIDEMHFQIHLNYLEKTQELSSQCFKDLLEKFIWIAENWRLYLDEHDKNDLIYVRVNK